MRKGLHSAINADQAVINPARGVAEYEEGNGTFQFGDVLTCGRFDWLPRKASS